MVKIVCINDNYWKYRFTKNKIYNILKEYGNFYLVKDDINHIDWYAKEYFELLSEYRNKKIDKLLG
jgi:hypothetical protein